MTKYQVTSPVMQLLILVQIACVAYSLKLISQQHRRHTTKFPYRLWLASQSSNTISAEENTFSSTAVEGFSLVTYNILAPCYKRIAVPPIDDNHDSSSSDSHNRVAKTTEESTSSSAVESRPSRRIFESEYPVLYIPRNEEICRQLLQTQADIICLQEYWTGSEDMQSLYYNRLCIQGGYELRTLERTSHWRRRSDGLAIFVKKDRLVLEDVREILYHDCGDRIALMLVLSLLPSEDNAKHYPPQRFICINTHLLFPHNEYSTKIRLREVTKLLGFVESYKQKELCGSICTRSDVRLPVLIAGDFNGSPKGSVFQFMQSQNFHSALQEACVTALPGTSACSPALIETVATQNSNAIDTSSNGKESEKNSNSKLLNKRWQEWISHRSHRGTDVAVDHVFFINPSEQTPERLPPLPDWTNLVYFEVFQKILAEFGVENMRDAFARFDQDASNYISKEEFSKTLERLGFFGENSAALTSEEIDVLISSADKNDDGTIDYKEFYDRFWLAAETVAMEKTPIEQERLLLAETKREYDTNNDSSNSNVIDLNSEVSSISAVSTSSPLWTKKTAGLLLNGQRFTFARSKWLLRNNSNKSNNNYPAATVPLVPSSSSYADNEKFSSAGTSDSNSNSNSSSLVENKKFLFEEMEASMLPDAVNMGDIQVQQVSLFPEALENGVWPETYTLSDHGMVICRFLAQLRPAAQ